MWGGEGERMGEEKIDGPPAGEEERWMRRGWERGRRRLWVGQKGEGISPSPPLLSLLSSPPPSLSSFPSPHPFPSSLTSPFTHPLLSLSPPPSLLPLLSSPPSPPHPSPSPPLPLLLSVSPLLPSYSDRYPRKKRTMVEDTRRLSGRKRARCGTSRRGRTLLHTPPAGVVLRHMWVAEGHGSALNFFFY